MEINMTFELIICYHATSVLCLYITGRRVGRLYVDTKRR